MFTVSREEFVPDRRDEEQICLYHVGEHGRAVAIASHQTGFSDNPGMFAESPPLYS